MVFTSHLFLFWFLPLTLGAYYACPRRGKHLLLTLLSYAFYGWANPLFIVLMFFGSIIDYFTGLVIGAPARRADGEYGYLEKGVARSRAQRVALWVSIVSNLLLLGFFKYFNFGVDSINGIGAWFGAGGDVIEDALHVTLPLGISFYIFQSMSYAIDVYRGEARTVRNVIDYQCFVALFPQLVAGPIIRFQEIDDQLRQRTHTAEKFARGVAFLALGMLKKIWLANPCGKVADLTFDADPAALAAPDAWLGMVAYAMQIYFDFSAYSDMAIGLGLMLGFVFPKNFDSPYLATSITEFWQKWHISLSTWLREYLYIPLGGNRLGDGRTYVNLALVMLLGGLWHGASWNFVIWGGIHGGWLALERWLGKDSFYARLPVPARIGITFLIVCLAWVFFRAATLDGALGYLGALVGLGDGANAPLTGALIWQPYYLLSLAAALVVVWGCPQTWDWTRTITPLKAAMILIALVAAAGYMSIQAYNPFIYFIF